MKGVRSALTYLGFLAAVLLVVSASAQQTVAPQKPVREAPRAKSATTPASKPESNPKPSASALSPDLSKEPFVIEKYFTTVRFENDGTGERVLHVRARVVDDSGVQQLSDLVFGYNAANESVALNYLRVEKKDGSVMNASADAAKDLSAPILHDAAAYADYKEKHIAVPALRPGDSLEYDVSTRTVTPAAPGQFWYEHNFIDAAVVLDERLEVNLPANRTVILRSIGVPFAQDDADGRKIYRWKHDNLSAKSHDEDAASSDSHKSGARDSTASAVELTSFTSWDGIAKWYSTLERGRTEPNADIRAKVLDLTKTQFSQSEKIRALYEYVSKNIRYVNVPFGLDGYEPHAAAEVFKNQYGDSKDKHTLLAAMLDVIGVHADAAFVPQRRKADTATPSPAQFDHVITEIPSGRDASKNPLWLDATSEVAPFQYLPPNLRGKKALLISADGASHLTETPENLPFQATQDVDIEGHVSDLGKLMVKIHYALRGDNEFAFRNAFRRAPKDQWLQIGQTVAVLDGFHGDVTNVEASDPLATEKPFEMTFQLSQTNFLDWSSKSMKLAVPLPTIGMPEAPSDDSARVLLGTPLDVTLRLKLTLPASESARAPVGVAIVRDYAEFHSSYNTAGGDLIVDRTIRFKLRDVPASRAGDYAAFARAVAADQSQLVTVKNTAPGEAQIPASATSDDLIEAGVAALDAGNAQEASAFLRRASELDPKRKDVWSSLGLACLRLGDFDSAAAAFRKQIEIDPRDENAYNYLGATLVRQQKLDDAAAAFREQIVLNPLDKFAHASLGILLVQQKKYAEAVPELEKAAILAPDNAPLHIALGEAYLNGGKTTEALAAFDKAARISPTSKVWNDIAYDLAQHDFSLEKAQQYAGRAIDATSAALRAVKIDHVTPADLAEVQNIGAFWDTLGWIHFEQGNFDGAEPFLRAAWQLTQNGDVGDHLAQLYEKRGKKEAAIRLYALSLAAPHPDSETRTRLASLLGDPANADDAAKNAARDLIAERTLSAGKFAGADASADFYIVLAPGKKGATVEAVKFVRGSESLRDSASRLREISYGDAFPNEASTKLIRRGTLTCTKESGECKLVLALPGDILTPE